MGRSGLKIGYTWVKEMTTKNLYCPMICPIAFTDPHGRCASSDARMGGRLPSAKNNSVPAIRVRRDRTRDACRRLPGRSRWNAGTRALAWSRTLRVFDGRRSGSTAFLCYRHGFQEVRRCGVLRRGLKNESAQVENRLPPGSTSVWSETARLFMFRRKV